MYRDESIKTQTGHKIVYDTIEGKYYNQSIDMYLSINSKGEVIDLYNRVYFVLEPRQ